MATVTNKKFSKPVEPVLQSITLELSAVEAELVRFLSGRVLCSKGKYGIAANDIWGALQRAGTKSISDKVELEKGEWDTFSLKSK